MKKYKKRLTDDEILYLIESGLKPKQIRIVGVSHKRLVKIAKKNSIIFKETRGRPKNG